MDCQSTQLQLYCVITQKSLYFSTAITVNDRKVEQKTYHFQVYFFINESNATEFDLNNTKMRQEKCEADF